MYMNAPQREVGGAVGQSALWTVSREGQWQDFGTCPASTATAAAGAEAQTGVGKAIGWLRLT